MNRNDIVVTAENVSKTYRLYKTPTRKILDVFGLLRGDNNYAEHSALTNVNLQIRRGERVAFIGRNGAGKSTLLKLITGVIQPSSGSLNVNPGVHALLQIGTGFHPEFTGRQNALAYLAHLGFTGAIANEKLHEIIDFAEIENYIDQPIKTYSTGMIARLMFSTSTAIKPELLVLDEILGVGDAYFSNKSFERIREMCNNEGTTVLLVSHDIYSAAKLCERMIWIDHGTIIFDGSSSEAIKAYELSIRQQEEERLRKRNITFARKSLAPATVNCLAELTVELSSPTGINQTVNIAAITIKGGDNEILRQQFGSDTDFSSEQPIHLVAENSNWGGVTWVDGRAARELNAFGSPFQKSIIKALLHQPILKESEPLRLCLDVQVKAAERLSVACYDQHANPIFNRQFDAAPGQWERVEITAGSEPEFLNDYLLRPIGSGHIRIDSVKIVDDDCNTIFQVNHADKFRLLIDVVVQNPGINEYPDIVVAFHRNGSQDVARYLCRHIKLDGRQSPKATIALDFDSLPLSAGAYAITVLVAKQSYYDTEQTQYFTINPSVYACLSRCLEFEILRDSTLSAGTLFVGEASWSVSFGATPAPNARRPRALSRSQLAGVVRDADAIHGLDVLFREAQHIVDSKEIAFCPGWSFSSYLADGSPLRRRRQVLFDIISASYHAPPLRITWVDGIQLDLPLQGDIARCVYVGGTYDPNELATLKAIMKPGMAAVDVGANIGLYTLFLSNLVGDTGTVWAFEPSSRERQQLVRNLEINVRKNTQVFPEALSSYQGTKLLYIAPDDMSGHNSLLGVQRCPVIRVSITGAATQWLTAWSGTETFAVPPSHSIEFFIYSELNFFYQIFSLCCNDTPVEIPHEIPLRDTHEQPGRWRFEKSENIAIEKTGHYLELHGRESDFLRIYWENTNEELCRVSLSGVAVLDCSGEHESVPVTTLDDAAKSRSLEKLDFLKIDTEGSESEIIRGALEMISKNTPFILLEHSVKQKPKESKLGIDWLRNLGYLFYRFSVESGRPEELQSVDHSGNILAVHESRRKAIDALVGNPPISGGTEK
jgi:FkbM family methyltransferase